jgi:hypothetical protein
MLITALENRPEADLTSELEKNKLMQEYMRRTESCYSGQAMQAETEIMVYLLSIKKLQESAVISVRKWVT